MRGWDRLTTTALYAIYAAALIMIGFVFTPCHAQDLATPSCANHLGTPTNSVVVPGFPEQRLYIYRKNPLLCTDSGTGACVPSAYVLSGDRLLVDPNSCDGWSYVTYKGKELTSGWAAATALGRQMGSRRDFAARPGIEAEISPQMACVACQAAREALNAYLKHTGPQLPPPLPTALRNRTPLQHLPGQIASTFGGGGDAWNVRIEGRQLMAITYYTGGTCDDQNLELWNKELTHRYPLAGSNADGNPDRGYTSEDIVTLAGHPYFAHYSRSLTVTLSAFTPSLTSHEIATLSMVPAPLTATRVNHDPSLSEAMLHGEISGASIYDIQPYMLAPAAFGFGTQGPKVFQYSVGPYTIVARGRVDLENDRQQVNVGVLYFQDGTASAGCGHDVDAWVPIELDSDGMPKAGSQFNEEMIEHAQPGQDMRLFE